MTVEDLLGFVFVIVAIVSSIMKNKKKMEQAKGRKAAQQARAAKPQTNRAPYSMESLQSWFEENAQAADKTQPVQAAKPAEPAVAASTGSIKEQTHEGMHPCQEHDDAPQQVAQPRIQARVQVTEKPRVMVGSMGVDSHEGIHPCDDHKDELLQSERPLVAMPVEKPGIQLDWTGENLVKAFIMQEVLTRPCQRKRA